MKPLWAGLLGALCSAAIFIPTAGAISYIAFEDNVTQDDVRQASADAEASGYDDGKADGYAVGEAAGYDAGYAAARAEKPSAACQLIQQFLDNPVGGDAGSLTQLIEYYDGNCR